MKNKKLREEVLKISEGVVSTLVDLLLGEIFFGIEYFLGYERYKLGYSIDKAVARSSEDLAKINYKSIKKALSKLKRRGLLNYIVDEGVVKPVLTAQGKKRLKAILPAYVKNRPWNGKLYFIFYDFPETSRRLRDIFRNHLRRIGARMVQKSVYLIWYDPSDILCEFVKEHNLKTLVVISCLGKDGYVIGEKIKDLVDRVYELDKLNNRYREFLTKYSKQNQTIPRSRIAFEFLSILEDDSQLPFELLPKDWAGEKAYRLYEKLTSPTSS